MGINPTASLINIESSIRRFLIEQIYQGLEIPVLFGQAYAYPTSLQSTEWVDVEFGNPQWGHVSRMFNKLIVCCKKGFDDHYVNSVVDQIRGVLTEADNTSSTDGWKRMTLYQYKNTQPWTVIGHAQIIEVFTPSGVVNVEDAAGFRYRELMMEMAWAAAI